MNLHIFSNQDEQVAAILDSFLSTVTKILNTKDQITIALSGGKSPIPFLEKLSFANLDFSKITFTLVDERIVDQSSIDSNENLLRTYLLKNNAISAKFINLMEAGKTPNQMKDSANQRVDNIDLAILGMGEDGHTASIFPDCAQLQEAIDLNNINKFIITNPISAKYQRISLTLAEIIKIPNLILSINGKTKLNVLNEAILGDNLNYPVSFVLTRKPETQIFWYE